MSTQTRPKGVAELHDSESQPILANALLNAAKTADDYISGDIYQRSPTVQQWEVNTHDYPYLAHVKSLADTWRQLRYLADWMEVGTSPNRWSKHNLASDIKQREERARRTKVTLLEYRSSTNIPPTRTDFNDAENLTEALASHGSGGSHRDSAARLFFVEDLSRQVIELLGSTFDVDPLFFREHIHDHAWFNTRAPWAVAPSLQAATRHRQWFTVRNMRLRYFTSKASFDASQKEAAAFNVERRPDNDRNHWNYGDADDSIVALVRTRTSVWVGKPDGEAGGTVAIIVVDPTVTEGYPLWQGYNNWASTPSFKADGSPPKPPPGTSMFDDLIHWTLSYPWYPSTSTSPTSPPPQSSLQLLVQPVLFAISAEWLVVCDYLKTRLSQIEWGVELPGTFRTRGDAIDYSLKKLHTWRRTVPLLREMVTDTLKQSLPTSSRLLATANDEWDSNIEPDYKRISSILEELQARVDRITDVVANEITMEDARREMQENHNLSRLTWLATTFIPLSFVTGLFSMAEDISSMRATFGWYFATAIPLTIITMLIALSVHKWHDWFQFKNEDRKDKKGAKKKST